MANNNLLQCLHFSYVFFIFCLISFVYSETTDAEIEAFIPIRPGVFERDHSGLVILGANKDVNVLLIGWNFSKETEVLFTHRSSHRGHHCEGLGQLTKSFAVEPNYENNTYRASVTINLDVTKEGQYFYFCIKHTKDNKVSWIHQGDDVLRKFSVVEVSSTFMPLWLQISLIFLLLSLSGLFSGLNLGLLSLDITELKIIRRCGKPNEKEYAKVITPLRKRGNFLLCTLLLGNVLVNNSLTILLDNISNGLIAVVSATAFIVIFGEIVPQAICSRYGLVVGAKTRFITYFFMIATFPLSFPISLILDKILGEEIGQVYSREKLQELIRLTKDFSALDEDEVNIISGALTLTKKTVSDIMTRIEDVYMLDYEDFLNFDTMSDIMKRGYSRIPVYENEKSNIVALLNIKDLALIDPDDNTPLKTVCKFYQHHLIFVFDDHRLDQMLQDFRQGHSHMAIVRRVNNEGPGDPFYETMGVVTLEDVIEEIIQSEIIDETDTLTDNIKKFPRMLPRQDFSIFNQPDDGNKHLLPPQLSVAAFQFLSTSVDPFTEQYLSDNVLRKLIKQNIVFELNPEHAENQFIYKEGVPCDYFVLVLQGHVLVTVGKEKLIFQGGPFSYYGVNALAINDNILSPFSSTDSIYVKHEPFVPDFTMVPADTLLFLRIKRPHYIVARRATLMSREQKRSMKEEEETFNKEWTKIHKLESVNHETVEIHPRVTSKNIEAQTANTEKLAHISTDTNVKSLLKRTDSKDSGWSFPTLDKHLELHFGLEANSIESNDKLTGNKEGRTYIFTEGNEPDCVLTEDINGDGDLKKKSDSYLYIRSSKSCDSDSVIDDDKTNLIPENQVTGDPKQD